MPDEETSGGSHSESHRLKLTPEQRRVLGPARTRQDWHAPPSSGEREPEASSPPPGTSARQSRPASRESGPTDSPVSTPPPRSARIGQLFQAQNVALFFAGLILLGAVFYFGKKFDYLRYELMTRMRAPKPPTVPNRFPNLSADELVEQALIDERLSNWRQAAEKLIAAKHKNLGYPGLLFHAGKLYYDHDEFDLADALFDRAVAFRENVDEANYLRGMIASGRGDYSTAQQFFDAAAAFAPFNPQYGYSAAEALRRMHRPAEAIRRYQQAAFRGTPEEESTCQFKMRMAAIEAGDAPKVAADLEKRTAAGPLTVDWIMTQAALAIQAGRMEDAIATINRARDKDDSFLQGRFAACAGDKFFIEAANSAPALAQALRVAAKPGTSTP